jgi:ferredoxin--NADP+ reductase
MPKPATARSAATGVELQCLCGRQENPVMIPHGTERVLHVHHWNEHLFSFTTTRQKGLRFESGQFVMLGIEVDGKTLMRAYSIASAAYDEHLEFFSIKVADGALTSRLQQLKEGDAVLVSRKPTGTLVLHDLLPGRHLYLLSTGTGLAPFLSIIRDPHTYERFAKVVLVHGVRHVSDLAYADFIRNHLPQHEYLGETVRRHLIYYPTVTREPFPHRGRITDLIPDDRFFSEIGLPPPDAALDRAMICGSPAMLRDCSELLERRGFKASAHVGVPGDYVIERAFVDE